MRRLNSLNNKHKRKHRLKLKKSRVATLSKHSNRRLRTNRLPDRPFRIHITRCKPPRQQLRKSHQMYLLQFYRIHRPQSSPSCHRLLKQLGTLIIQWISYKQITNCWHMCSRNLQIMSYKWSRVSRSVLAPCSKIPMSASTPGLIKLIKIQLRIMPRRRTRERLWR